MGSEIKPPARGNGLAPVDAAAGGVRLSAGQASRRTGAGTQRGPAVGEADAVVHPTRARQNEPASPRNTGLPTPETHLQNAAVAGFLATLGKHERAERAQVVRAMLQQEPIHACANYINEASEPKVGKFLGAMREIIHGLYGGCVKLAPLGSETMWTASTLLDLVLDSQTTQALMHRDDRNEKLLAVGVATLFVAVDAVEGPEFGASILDGLQPQVLDLMEQKGIPSHDVKVAETMVRTVLNDRLRPHSPLAYLREAMMPFPEDENSENVGDERLSDNPQLTALLEVNVLEALGVSTDGLGGSEVVVDAVALLGHATDIMAEAASQPDLIGISPASLAREAVVRYFDSQEA